MADGHLILFPIAALAGFGLLFILFSSYMAKLFQTLAAIVFKFPCRICPSLRPIVHSVFHHPRLKLFIRLRGLAYLLSAFVLWAVVSILSQTS